MNKRSLSGALPHVSEIGFGCRQLTSSAWHGPNFEEAVSLVSKALDLGINLYDTSPAFTAGRSEKVLGTAFRSRRERVVLISKYCFNPEYKTGAVKSSLEHSLQRLQSAYIDILLLESPGSYSYKQYQNIVKELCDLTEQGIVLLTGISAFTAADFARYKAAPFGEVVAAVMNLLEGYDLPVKIAQKYNKKLIALSPLARGSLTDKMQTADTAPVPEGDYSGNTQYYTGKLGSVKKIIGSKMTLQHAAIKYILSLPEVSAVCPGIKNIFQLQDIVNTAAVYFADEIKVKLAQV
ncbi:MAG TPA: aldo/keto reductase [Spirochaetota bacterium]|nr:aldo/keto reductase [Spirochaetota bacterium]